MGARTTASATTTTAGILRPEDLARFARITRHPCAAEVADVVENYWSLTWALPGDSRYVSSTLPHPAANLSVERGAVRPEVTTPVVVTGVVTRRFDVELRGSGWVFAAKLKPGGLARLTGVPARASRDRTMAAAELFPADLVAKLAELDDTVPAAECVRAFDVVLGGLPRPADPDYHLVLRLVADMLADRELTQVGQVIERHGLGRRRLERLFAHYLGTTPKWVLARYRMHDVVARMDDGYAGSLAELAAEYGWYDQAHFGRDFRRLVGVSPSAYLARPKGGSPEVGPGVQV